MNLDPSETLYILEKKIWTQADFLEMGWHDSWIHGLAVTGPEDGDIKNELVLDIDYIFNWVEPRPPSSYFTFWVSPCTLIFKDIYDLVINVELNFHGLEVSDLKHVEKLKNEHNGIVYDSWELELQCGEITLKSRGYEQIVRRPPHHTRLQTLKMEERGGITFGRESY